MVAHAFNLELRWQRNVDLCELEARVVYITSPRTVSAI